MTSEIFLFTSPVIPKHLAYPPQAIQFVKVIFLLSIVPPRALTSKVSSATLAKQFGEGEVNAVDGFFKDGDEKQFTTEDFRFTYKDGYLYAFQMRPSKTVNIKTLKKHIPHDYLIESIELLGSDEKIDYSRDENSLKITLKTEIENDLPICFKIKIG